VIVTTTEVQNNFGKYLKLAENEDVIITRNGHKIARLIKYKKGDGFIQGWRSRRILGS
jgi:prevent-host-death family protein